MIHYEEAIQLIKAVSNNLSIKTEKIDLLQSVGRVLAQDIISNENIPQANNSSMDGFAVNASETLSASKENPKRFQIQSSIAAGDYFIENSSDLVKKNNCIEIMTGAHLPQSNYDAVVKVEDVQRCGNEISLNSPVLKGTNVRPKGTDFSIGQKVLNQNTIIKDQHVMAMAALGISTVEVKKKIRVAVLSTGNEIVPFDQLIINDVQVRNASAPFLKCFLERNHCDVTLLGIFKDDAKSFFEVMSNLLNSNYDLILTTGAVSMGKWDFITNTLPDLNMKVLFHKVAIRPGKPILLAQSPDNQKILFGLPGNPISSAVGAKFFVLPLIEKLLKIESAEHWMNLQSDVAKPDGLECFYKAKIAIKNNTVEALAGQASYMIHSFVESQCWAQLPAAGSLIKAGTSVRVFDL